MWLYFFYIHTYKLGGQQAVKSIDGGHCRPWIQHQMSCQACDIRSGSPNSSNRCNAAALCYHFSTASAKYLVLFNAIVWLEFKLCSIESFVFKFSWFNFKKIAFCTLRNSCYEGISQISRMFVEDIISINGDIVYINKVHKALSFIFFTPAYINVKSNICFSSLWVC